MTVKVMVRHPCNSAGKCTRPHSDSDGGWNGGEGYDVPSGEGPGKVHSASFRLGCGCRLGSRMRLRSGTEWHRRLRRGTQARPEGKRTRPHSDSGSDSNSDSGRGWSDSEGHGVASGQGRGKYIRPHSNPDSDPDSRLRFRFREADGMAMKGMVRHLGRTAGKWTRPHSDSDPDPDRDSDSDRERIDSEG
jgi:hypothetical protein